MGIKAIPTLYNGVQYRSRLEARWACFFESLGWKALYEPLDCDGYIPDFILGSTRLVVEVKPVFKFDRKIVERVVNATSGSELGQVLLVGADLQSCWGCGGVSIGWTSENCSTCLSDWGEGDGSFFWGLARSYPNSCLKDSQPGDETAPVEWNEFFEEMVYGKDVRRFCGHDDGAVRKANELWNRAGNQVQWKSPQRRR